MTATQIMAAIQTAKQAEKIIKVLVTKANRKWPENYLFAKLAAVLPLLLILLMACGCMTYVREVKLADSPVHVEGIRGSVNAQIGVQTRGQHIPGAAEDVVQEGGGRADTALDIPVNVDRSTSTPAAGAEPAAITNAPAASNAVSGISTGDFAGVTFLGVNVSGWAQTATLKASYAGGKVGLDYDKASAWPAVDGAVGNAWAIVEKDGQKYAATWEWLKPGQVAKDMAGKSWAGHFKRSELDGWEPTSGDRIGLFTSGLCRDDRRNVSERSNVSWVTVE